MRSSVKNVLQRNNYGILCQNLSYFLKRFFPKNVGIQSKEISMHKTTISLSLSISINISIYIYKTNIY